MPKFHEFLCILHPPQMETDATMRKLRRYDLSMSKRTRRTNNATVAAEANTGEERSLEFAPIVVVEQSPPPHFQGHVPHFQTPITSEEKKEAEQAFDYDHEVVVKETVFAPTTPRPSLKELIQVTNKEERSETEVTKQNLVREKVSEGEKENLLSVAVHQHQIAKVAKSPSVVRRCAKALNQMIKVRNGTKQKNVVHLIAI